MLALISLPSIPFCVSGFFFLSGLEVSKADVPKAEPVTGAQQTFAERSIVTCVHEHRVPQPFRESPLKWLSCPRSTHSVRPVACKSHCPRFCWRPALPEVTVSEAWATPHVRCGQAHAPGSAVPEACGGSGYHFSVTPLHPNLPWMSWPFQSGAPTLRHRVTVCRSGCSTRACL